VTAARVDVIAPSGALLSAAGFEAGIARLEALGCRVRSRVPGSAWLRFAGSDDARLAQIHDAARADDVDLVMITRGGYGLSRLLDRIDWPLVARSVARGVRWVGFSDFTVFQLALLAETGAASWAGPAVCGDFGAGEPDPYMLAQFRELLQGRTPVVEWAAGSAIERADWGGERGADDRAGIGAGEGALALPAMPEAIEGTLWGGNLAMLASLSGTPWMPAVDGGILFVEDVAEHPYRVERMLLQLLHAGVLGRQKAILLGAFTEWKPAPHDNGFDLSTVRAHLAERLGIPVIPGLPFGHVPRRAVLGVGLRYRLARVSGDVGAASFSLSAA